MPRRKWIDSRCFQAARFTRAKVPGRGAWGSIFANWRVARHNGDHHGVLFLVTLAFEGQPLAKGGAPARKDRKKVSAVMLRRANSARIGQRAVLSGNYPPSQICGPFSPSSSSPLSLFPLAPSGAAAGAAPASRIRPFPFWAASENRDLLVPGPAPRLEPERQAPPPSHGRAARGPAEPSRFWDRRQCVNQATCPSSWPKTALDRSRRVSPQRVERLIDEISSGTLSRPSQPTASGGCANDPHDDLASKRPVWGDQRSDAACQPLKRFVRKFAGRDDLAEPQR